MKMGRLVAIALPGIIACGVTAAAQNTTQVHAGRGGSPHVKTTWTIDGANISITYGRPYLKGRDIKTMEPAGQIWRVGADEATTLTTDKALKFGTLNVPAGSCTLFAVPGESQWQLVINKQTEQWGTDYDQKQDLGRVPMTVSSLAKPVEQLTFVIDDTPAGARLHIDWGTVRATTEFSVTR
jgi:hypothetical protein